MGYGAGTGIEFLPTGIELYDLELGFDMAIDMGMGPPNSWVVVVVVIVEDDFRRLSSGRGSNPWTGGRESGCPENPGGKSGWPRPEGLFGMNVRGACIGGD